MTQFKQFLLLDSKNFIWVFMCAHVIIIITGHLIASHPHIMSIRKQTPARIYIHCAFQASFLCQPLSCYRQTFYLLSLQYLTALQSNKPIFKTTLTYSGQGIAFYTNRSQVKRRNSLLYCFILKIHFVLVL